MSRWSTQDGGLPLFVHVAVGVFVGTLAAAFVVWRLSIWQAERLMSEAASAVVETSAAADLELQRGRAAAQRVEMARRAQAASSQRADDQARRLAADEAARREAAWERFYRKPVGCDDARGGSWTVDCANEFMRAKKRFAELYDAGKL